jgi:hypothetical protein
MTTRIPENFPAWFVGCNLAKVKLRRQQSFGRYRDQR